MDFNRSGQLRPSSVPSPSAAAPQKPNSTPAPKPEPAPAPSSAPIHGRLHRWSFIALLVSGTILFVAMIFFIVFGTPVNRESRFVNKDLYQAVFVNVNGTNGGQVYFGKITSMTQQYIRLANVFYIQNQAQEGSQNSGSYNLVKLGCELHGPTDEMLINRNQVFFWENLKSDSQVAQKAKEFYDKNPDGQKCNGNSNSTQQSNTNTQNPSNTQTTPPTTPPASDSPDNKDDTDNGADNTNN